MPDFTFQLNAKEVTVSIDDPKTSSLEVLREVLGIHTCKAGCSPQGLCGCCTALIDGKPRLTCTLPVKSLAGKAITTMDGLPEHDKEVLAESFVRAGGTQCGYCTPGIVLNTWSVLQGQASPTREDLTRALNAHLCRCTGYTAIYAAMERAAAVLRGEEDPLPPRPRPEGTDVALGDRPYVDDLERPGMLYGGLVLAPVGAGKVDAVDVEAARAVPGVRAVLVRREAGATLAHPGEIAVTIAAESPAALREAQKAVVIQATAAGGAPEAVVVAKVRRVDGDVDAALAKAKHTASGTYSVAATDPLYLEPEAALAVPVEGGLHVYSAGHDATGEAAALSAALGVAVRVFLVPSGGSYGGKELVEVSRAAAELALSTGQPVRFAAGMEAGMRLHPRRPPAVVQASAGLDAKGRLVALRVDCEIDGGAAPLSADALVAQAAAAIPYDVPNLEVNVRVVRTGSPVAGPVRGGGGVAVVHAVESVLGEAARAAGLDGLAVRRQAALPEAAAALDAVAEAWAGAGEARGIALAQAAGGAGARVVLTVTGPGEVEVQCNVPELGQGRDEALGRVLAAETGLPADRFVIAWGDSSVVGAAAPVHTPVEGAARAAAHALVAVGGSLAGLVGRRFVGEAPEAAPPGYVAAVAVGGEGDALATVHVAGLCGADQEARMVANLLEGAAHMGVGVALSESVDDVEGLPEWRLRYLGLLKPKNSPAFLAHPVTSGLAARDVAEAAVMAVPAAVAGLVAVTEGAARDRLPMKESAAAKAAGVRLPRHAR